LLAFLPLRGEKQTWRAIKRLIPPLWVATLLVEGPLKWFFRRRRPFIDIVRAVVVGKKPANWSFPSGHAASAFSGAYILARLFPALRGLWYAIAGLVGFSRLYVGAHYPGDIVSGSLLGYLLAALTDRLLGGERQGS
jgi:undecaprenyl-diphosphatase